MQKLFQNKSITQKIIIAIVFVILFNFTSPYMILAETAKENGTETQDTSEIESEEDDDFGFIFNALAWLIVKITDVIQWIISFCLTGDSSMMMGHAYWYGKEENKDKWDLSDFFWENIWDFGVKQNALTFITGESEWWENKNAGVYDSLYMEWPRRHLITPADIFTGKILITNINFFSDYTKVEDAIASEKQVFSSDSTAESMNKLRTAISKWYNTIRNITIVGLLSVLVYIAIEMVISSASQDKAKYQKMLTDWLVAICLVFLLHYIMAITVGICNKLTNIMNDNINDGFYLDEGDRFVFIDLKTDRAIAYGSLNDHLKNEKVEPIQGLAERIRVYTQTSYHSKAMGYAIMYFAITGYTVIFLWTYMKRFVYMAFFTLIAPIVALTYPIDKVKDGASQAFDGWLKNYIYNALIQPFDLMIYTVFIGLAYDLASSNFIYVIVVLGTIPFADKQLGSWMGMDKASTRKGIAEGLQGVLAFKGLTSIFGGSKSASSGSSSSLSSSSSSSGSYKKPTIRTNKNEFLNRTDDIDIPDGNSPDGNPTDNSKFKPGKIKTKDNNINVRQTSLPQGTPLPKNAATTSNKKVRFPKLENAKEYFSLKDKKYSDSRYRNKGKRFTRDKSKMENFGNFAYKLGYNAKEKGKTMLKNTPRKILGTAGTILGAGIGAAAFGVFGQSATSGLIAGGALGKKAGNSIAGVGENIAKGSYKIYEDVLQSDERKIMKEFKGNLELQRKAGSKERRQAIAAVAAENGVGIKEAIGLVDMAEEVASLEGIDIDDAISVVSDANNARLALDPTEWDNHKEEQIQRFGKKGQIYADTFDALGKLWDNRYENTKKARIKNERKIIEEEVINANSALNKIDQDKAIDPNIAFDPSDLSNNSWENN